MMLRASAQFIGIAIAFATAASAQEAAAVAVVAAYRERIALPAEAVLEATLEDVSRADAPANVVGRTRLEKPGQPPFRFSIRYDPAQIVGGRTYSVRVRIAVGGKLWFVTDRTYPVMIHGPGAQVSVMLVRSAGPGGAAASRLGTLPAGFEGLLPCADCPGIRWVLNLFPDKSYFLHKTYTGSDTPRNIDDLGTWELGGDGSTLVLSGNRASSDSFAVKGADILRKLNLQGREIESAFNYDLRRTPVFEPLEPRLEMKGMFLYMADAAIFTECRTGRRFPVAMEAKYKDLERDYLTHRRQPGEELLVGVDGQVASRPHADTGRPVPTLIVERHTGVWPGESCGMPFGAAQLQETYWKLTRLDDKPVVLAKGQREPSLVFRSQGSRVTGFSGCNSLTGGYTLNGGQISFIGMASTRMACVQGMDIEAAFLTALGKVRTWKISGHHLELNDADGNALARFEAGLSK